MSYYYCLSVCLSVHIRVRPFDFCFEIGLPYLALGCITMRRCAMYIHDPDTTLNFDPKVKCIGFLTCFCVRPITNFDLTQANHIWHIDLLHEKMCHVHSCPQFDVDLLLKGQFYIWIYWVYGVCSCLSSSNIASVLHTPHVSHQRLAKWKR